MNYLQETKMLNYSNKNIQKLIKQEELPQKSFGLWNIQKRLQTMGCEEGLQFCCKENESFRIYFELPVDNS